MASNRGYSSIVSLLIQNGAKLDAAKDGTTALMCACTHGFKDVAFLLLDASIEIDAVNSKGWTSLMLAAEKGCYQILCRLIKMGANVNAHSTDARWTSLMSASSNGFTDIAEALISAGAAVNAQQAGGWSALMIAVQAGQASIVRLLLQHGGRIYDRKEEILIDATKAQLSEVPDGALPIIGATLGGHAEIVSLLLEHGAKTTTTTSAGKTPLMLAAISGNKACLEVLIRRGAAVPTFGDFGYTVSRICWVRVRTLLGAGGDVKMIDVAVPQKKNNSAEAGS